MNKQHKFDIIYEFYHVKKTFIHGVLQWETERKFVVLITVNHKIIHLSPTHEFHI